MRKKIPLNINNTIANNFSEKYGIHPAYLGGIIWYPANY